MNTERNKTNINTLNRINIINRTDKTSRKERNRKYGKQFGRILSVLTLSLCISGCSFLESFGIYPSVDAPASSSSEQSYQEETVVGSKEQVDSIEGAYGSKDNGSEFANSIHSVLKMMSVTTAPKVQSSIQWYYNNLNENEQRVYDLLYQDLKNQEEEVTFGLNTPVDSETLSRILAMILAEHPELFYAGNSFRYKSRLSDDRVTYMYPQYSMSLDEYNQVWAQIEPQVNGVIESIRQNASSDYEAELMAHDWLVDFVDYYTDPNEENPTNTAVYRTMQGTFLDQKINCVGYAMTMTYIMNALGIPCSSISGYATDDDGKTVLHEWNFIQIGGQWYQLDACWDDPVLDDPTQKMNGISHAYLNVSSEQMKSSHETESNASMKGELPEFVSTDANYYVQNGLIVSSLEQFLSLLTNNMLDMLYNQTPLEIQFSSNELLNQVISQDTIGNLVSQACDVNAVSSVRYEYYTNADQNTMVLTLSFN